MGAKRLVALGQIARAAQQELESLQRAGVTHLRRMRPLRIAARPADQPSVALEEPEPAAVVIAPVPIVAAPVAAADADSRSAALEKLRRTVARCTQCSELAANRTQTVFGVGNIQPRLVFLGEAPGADEDRQGEPFVGRAGQLLNDIITKGMKLRREDVYILNILKCRPPNNRTPLPGECANCRPFLDAQLEILQPEFICCLGAVAAKNLLDMDMAIGKMRGRVFRYGEIRVICTYHPAYLLRNPAAKRDTWQDIQLLLAEMAHPAN